MTKKNLFQTLSKFAIYFLIAAGFLLLLTGVLLVFLSSLFVPAITLIAVGLGFLISPLFVFAAVRLGVRLGLVTSEKIQSLVENQTNTEQDIANTLLPNLKNQNPDNSLTQSTVATSEDSVKLATTQTVIETEPSVLAQQKPSPPPIPTTPSPTAQTNSLNPASFDGLLSQPQPQKKEDDDFPTIPPIIRPQVEAALRSYSGSGPLKICMFTAKEIKLIQALTLLYHQDGDIQNTDETIKTVENYIMGRVDDSGVYKGIYHTRQVILTEWLKKITPDCNIPLFSSPFEDTPLQLDEKSALELRKKYTLPGGDLDLIAEALKNPKYTDDYLLIPFLPEPEYLLYIVLKNKCGVWKMHPAMAEISELAAREVQNKIREVMKTSNIYRMFDVPAIGLDKNQVEEFKQLYFANTKKSENNFVI